MLEPRRGLRSTLVASLLLVTSACGFRALQQDGSSAMADEAAVAPPTPLRTAVLLPEVDTYVDPAQPTTSFAGKNLAVSSEGNEAKKIVYARFDLSPVETSAKITACQFYFTVDGTLSEQVVEILLVDNDSWSETITFKSAPAPTTTGLGIWLAEASQRVTTPAQNPVLVDQVQAQLAGDGKLSVQISSTFGLEGATTSNSYYSYETAGTAAKYGSGPRLIVQYAPLAQPLARDWSQFQADARHSGQTPWAFANTPTLTYTPETVLTGTQLSSPPVIQDGLLYLFTPTQLQVLNPAGKTLEPVVTGLANFASLALTPTGELYAAAPSELASFDLATGKKLASVGLSGSSRITAGADGSVYVTQGQTLYAFTQRLGTLVPSWSLDLGTSMFSPVTLSSDGSVAYIATSTELYALNSADGSLGFNHKLSQPASHLTIPVAGAANGLSYFGADDTLYVFRDIATPQSTFKGTGPISQPVIDAGDTLYVLQGAKIYTVSPDGTNSPSSSSIPGITATSPVAPIMDGAGNLYVIDNKSMLFVIAPDLAVANKPQTVDFPGRTPGLQVAPNGSLYASSDSALYRLNPGVAGPVTVTAYADRTSYRATASLRLDGTAVPSAASVVFQSGGTITIGPGFTIPVGTAAVFNTGY